MISEQGVLLLPPWGHWRSSRAWPTFSSAFLFQVSAAGAGWSGWSAYLLSARIRAWMRASWLWPNPDKSEVVLTGWGREGDGRTSLLCEGSLLFIVQIFRPRDLSGLTSALSITRRTKGGLFAFFWTAFLDQKVEPTLLNVGLSYTESSWEWTSNVQATLITTSAPGVMQAFLWAGWSSGLNAQLPLFTKAAALRDCTINENKRQKHLRLVY